MASPPVYARGVTRSVVVAAETTFGVQGAGPGQLLRRTSFTMDNQPPEIQSTEITEHSQALDARLGVNALAVTLAGQLSPGTYKLFLAGLLRGTWTAGVSASAMSDTALTINGTTGVATLSSTLTNFLTTGFKKGDVMRFSGVTSPAAAVNGVNLRCIGVAAGNLLISPNPALVAWASGQSSVGLAVTGKKLFTPYQSFQVYQSFSIESWNPGISESQLGLGIRPTQISLAAQPNGWVNFQMSAAGQVDQFTNAQVYTTPTDQSTSSGVTPTSGKISYLGTDLAYITGFNLQMAAAAQPVPGIGAKNVADIFMGMITARGSITCLTTNDTFTADFINENEVDIELFLPNSPAATADFVSVYIPRTRLWSNNRQDSDRALMRTVNFGALQQINGGVGTAVDNTTVVLQDSLA